MLNIERKGRKLRKREKKLEKRQKKARPKHRKPPQKKPKKKNLVDNATRRHYYKQTQSTKIVIKTQNFEILIKDKQTIPERCQKIVATRQPIANLDVWNFVFGCVEEEISTKTQYKTIFTRPIAWQNMRMQINWKTITHAFRFLWSLLGWIFLKIAKSKSKTDKQTTTIWMI